MKLVIGTSSSLYTYQKRTNGMMTGEHVSGRRCPVCGGTLEPGEATIPYVLSDQSVVIIKNVPAEICGDCREAFTSGKVTDQIVSRVRQLRTLHSEVSVISYSEYEAV
jgi:YgiT-type zinc finger domain-containing protein